MLEKCINCGFCKAECPVFAVERSELSGARGKAALIKAGIVDEVLFRCTLCGSCKVNCPLGIDLPSEVRKARSKRRLPGNDEMVQKTLSEGNPYGGKKGAGKDLNCC